MSSTNYTVGFGAGNVVEKLPVQGYLIPLKCGHRGTYAMTEQKQLTMHLENVGFTVTTKHCLKKV